MKLGEFIIKFIEPNSLIRLVYKGEENSIVDHIGVLEEWADVSTIQEILEGKGNNRHYINNEVLGITSILAAGITREAINIIIEKLESQPFIADRKTNFSINKSNLLARMSLEYDCKYIQCPEGSFKKEFEKRSREGNGFLKAIILVSEFQ